MDDINFDELDKAVSSAMKPATEPSVAMPAEPVQPPAVVSADSTPAEVTTPSPVLPVKRRGQFMDIVHTTNSRPTTPSVSREASTIKPLNPEIIKADGGIVGSGIAPEPAQADIAETSFEQPAAESTARQDFNVEAEPSTGPSAPVITPFVEGAQVEKRPLGAFADSDTMNETTAESTTEPASVAPEEPAAAETVTMDTPEVAESADESVGEQSESDVIDQSPDTTAPAFMNDDYATTLMPDEGPAQSIPQQYQVDNSLTASEDHSVFDTTQYHQPLLPPTKPNHGRKVLMYVLLVILMLAIGSAAGYAIFVLKLF